ncbi:hypothetical protein WMO63_14845 [Niallia sp. CLA-SR-H024]|jgi:hypothetical protein|uniref:Uncharacterized protein n=1 Tax=Niallia hominis TaxID=3133173 RepID=A0ABV1F0N2_9BACI|nr:hypothetical protein [Bacillus sp. T2.9-1]
MEYLKPLCNFNGSFVLNLPDNRYNKKKEESYFVALNEIMNRF